MRSNRDPKQDVGRDHGREPMADLLASHLQRGAPRPQASELSAEDRAELESLLSMARSLDAAMTPERPSPAFVRSLGRELVDEAGRRARRREKRHRIAVITAAVAGALVSIASVVGGIVMLVKWLRTRSDARHPSTA